MLGMRGAADNTIFWDETMSATERPEISVVIPFYNEEESIAAVCGETRRVLEEHFPDAWEIVLVNDGSRDRTGQLAIELAASSPRVRAVHLKPNSGQSAALSAGFWAARAPFIATLDGDGQNDPADIPRALEELRRARVDMVCGIRAKRQDTLIRKASSRIAFRVRNAILRDGVIDTGCSLKVFRRALMLRTPTFRNCHRYYPALFKMRGWKISQIPVNHRPRERGSSKYGGGINSRLWVGLADLAGVFWLKKRGLVFQVHEKRRDS